MLELIQTLGGAFVGDAKKGAHFPHLMFEVNHGFTGSPGAPSFRAGGKSERFQSPRFPGFS
jgi:hypothetical protein